MGDCSIDRDVPFYGYYRYIGEKGQDFVVKFTEETGGEIVEARSSRDWQVGMYCATFIKYDYNNTWKHLNNYTPPTQPEECSDVPKQVGGSHYQLAIQPIDYILKNNLGYCEGNVVKYVTRHKDKNGAEDIKKAIHYLEFILESMYASKTTEG